VGALEIRSLRLRLRSPWECSFRREFSLAYITFITNQSTLVWLTHL